MLVEGDSFYPRMLEDIAGATSSIHINQFGFKAGLVGDGFAAALIEKAAAGVPVRLVVDRQGSSPEGKSREFYRRMLDGGVEVCVVARHARRARRSGRSTRAARRAGTSPGSGTSTTARCWSSTAASAGSAAPGSRITSRTGASTTCSCARTGPVVAQLQLVFIASFRWLGGEIPAGELDALFPQLDAGGDPVPARVLHNAPGKYRPITDAIARMLEGARETLDVVNPYVTDRGMIRRIEDAARRGVRVRLFVPANANNWACAGAQQSHHAKLLDSGVAIYEYPTMLHAKAFVRDGEELLAGTCNLEAWSLKRFFEIDLLVRSEAVAAQFDERFSAPAVAVSGPGRRLDRAQAAARGRGRSPRSRRCSDGPFLRFG